MTEELKVAKQLAPGIVLIENALENPSHYINLVIQENNWNVAKIGVEGQSVEDIRYRSCNVSYLDVNYKTAIEWHYVSQLIWKYGQWYSQKFNIDFSEMETAQLLHYGLENNFYKAHSDTGPGNDRCFSALLYLNDVSEGGETFFTNFDIGIRPTAGSLALFPANYVFEHEARPPISEDKFVIVTWFRSVIL